MTNDAARIAELEEALREARQFVAMATLEPNTPSLIIESRKRLLARIDVALWEPA